ncbi:restriction endonuclease subunit S [Candidatus Poriferisodalis sp.]|uniref:restriction endonuclease subunit S n=1 Tax=Candidatus Poriferisodalis sp. TaxID=3101277 RepID=UPI003B0156C5
MTHREMPLLHIADIRISNVDKKTRMHEQSVRLVNYTDVYYGDRITPDSNLMRASASRDQVRNFGLKSGDVLITKDSELANDIGVPALIEHATHEMVCGYHLAMLRPRQEIVLSRYLYWLLNSACVRSQMEIAATGITRFGLRAEAIKRIKVTVLPHSEQLQIADYLDASTSHIDDAIAAKTQLKKLLIQRRSRLPEVALEIMRASEQMVPLKYLVVESNLRSDSRASRTLLSVSIHNGVVPRNDEYASAAPPEALARYKRCKPGDIVINRMRAFQGGVGQVRRQGVVSPDYTVLHVKDRVSSSYLHFIMRSPWFISEMTQRLRGIGSTDQGHVRTPRINFSELGEIRVPVPSRTRQDDLVSELIEREADIASALDLHGKQIELLTERRQALVTATVSDRI